MKSKVRLDPTTKWKCIHCSKEFKYQSERSRHEQSHFPQFECKVCDKKFSFLSAVRRHEKQHERTGSVHCNKCSGKFRDEILLKRHIQYAHKGTYTCKKCHATLHSESALRTHLKTHKPESERRYKCTFVGCTKSFNFPHHLKHHVLTHTDDKQYFCRLCGKGFIQLHHLKIHQRAHEPENWLPCTVPHCNKEFVNEYARKRHLATHRNKLEADSKTGTDAVFPKKSVKDTVLCISCGKMISRRHYDKHALKCNSSQELKVSGELPVTLPMVSVISFSVKDNNIIIEPKSERAEDINKDDKTTNKDEYDSIATKHLDNEFDKIDKDIAIGKDENTVNTCKAALGGCLVSGASEINGDCLCAQMASTIDDCYDLLPNPKIVQNSSNDFKTDNNKINKINNNIELCEGCECSDNYQKFGNTRVNQMPQMEYRDDGTVKIKETFDMDIKIDIGTEQSAKNDVIKYESKRETKDLKYVTFSCKDVLGNCIVSGNSTMGEGCLCAKMSMYNQQLIAQEIEEITPCPKDSWHS